MAKPIIIPVKADERMLSSSIERGASGAFRKLGSSAGAVAPLGRMMGKIRSDADEFTKSIEASNARVIAFGASVGVINAISSAFKKLVETTVRVEKVLTDVNVVLNTSSAGLQKFGEGLFKVAKNTAQSFDVVAEAALEFSRQGLSVEETLRRTNDALILTRLTGLKAADSVKGLTAAVNGFAKAGLTTTAIINKLAAVDVQFAVSADDLIDALSRTGAVAQQAGMNIDELIGMVTAAQQVTARGGAVIGNAFKTIFTRVQRPETLKTLRSLNIAVDDASGKSLAAGKVLQNLARDYDSLSQSAKSMIDQQVAGVFQINILKAAVGDLSKQNSLSSRATQISTSATDQAIRKNNQLNQTIAALSTQSGLALEELAQKIGDIALAPGMRDLVQSFKNIVEGISGVLDGEGTGSNFAKGLLKGIGNIITGPGLVVIGGVFLKLFKDLSVFGVKSMRNLLGLNNAAKQQAALQQGIGQLLAKNVGYEQAMVAAAGNVAKQSAITQGFLAKEVALRQRSLALTGAMATSMFGTGFRVGGAGALTARGGTAARAVKGVPGFAPEGVPNFAVGDISRSGVLDIGNTFPVASAEVLAGTGGQRNFTVDQLLKSLDTSTRKDGSFLKPGQANMKQDLRAWFRQNGVTGVSANFQLAPGAAVSPSDVGDFIDRTYGSSGGMEIGEDKVGRQAYRSILSNARNIATSEGVFHGRPVSAFTQALNDAGISGGQKTSLETMMNRGPIENELVRRIGGSGTGLGGDFIIDAVNSEGMPVEVKNRLLENKRAASHKKGPSFSQHSGNIGSNLFKSFSAKPALYDMFGGSELGERIQGGLRRSHSKFLGSIGADAPRGMQPRGRGVGRFFSMFRGAPGFAPIADAISREKRQVGSMLGISPSSVRTRVIQNTSLKSSFNPQGFGVISPTIGQRGFSDAKRMHRGENLKTANLPNFAGLNLPRPGGDIANVLGVKNWGKPVPMILSQIDPAAQRKLIDATMRGTQGARLDLAMQRAIEQSERKLRARAANLMPKGGPATFVGGGGGGGGGAGGTPARRGVVPFLKGAGGGVAAAGRGAMGMAGAALMHPVAQVAMMGPFIHSMAKGFVDTPTPQERFFQTPEQRRRGGRGQARFDAAAAGVIPGAKMGGALAAGGSIAMDVASLLGFAPQLGPFGKTRAATGVARLGMRAKSLFGAGAQGVGRGVGAAGSMGGRAVKWGAYGAGGGAAFGYGRGFFSGAQGRGFLSPEEFAQGSQFLGERGTEQVGQMTSIRDNVQIAGDSQRTAVDRLAANTAIQQTLNQIDDKDVRAKASKVLANTNLSRRDKGQQILKIQTEAAEANQRKMGRRSGVQGISSALTAQTAAGGNMASSDIASMFLNKTDVEQRLIGGQLREVGGALGAPRGTSAGTGSQWLREAGSTIMDDDMLEKFAQRGWEGVKDSLKKAKAGGGRQKGWDEYVQKVEKLADNFKDNEDLQHQIFQAMLFNKDIFADGAVDLKKVNAIIEDAITKAKASTVSVVPSPTEINNFQKQLDTRRALEDRLFQTDLGRTAGINAGARGVTAGTGAINAMMGAGMMTGATGQRRAGRLERAQFERSAVGRRSGIFDQASLSMGSIFGTGATTKTMGFDKHLRGMVEGGNIGGVLDRLRAMEAGFAVRTGGDGGEIFSTSPGGAGQADVKLIREQIKLLEARQKAIDSEDTNTKAQRENMEMRLRIAQDIARMDQPGIRAGQAINLSTAQMATAGSIAQARETIAANQVGRDALSSPFMTTDQQRDVGLQSQLRNIGFRRGQIGRQAKMGGLDLASGFLNRFSGVAANMRESANAQVGNEFWKQRGQADRFESAQTAFSTGITNLVKGPGGATVEGIEDLRKQFYDSIGDINSPEATQAKNDFEIFMTQLKEIAETKGLSLGDLIKEEDTAKQSRAMATLKDVTNDFRDAFASAMQGVSTGSASASDALRNFGIAFFGAINARAIGNIADQVSGALYSGLGGKQRGGFIEAQNGMYVSGSRTGDKNPAMLEDGEYVLNRNAVKALGGASSLDTMNFDMAPRFQGGGRNRFGRTLGRGKSYPRKFFNTDPLTLEPGQDVLDSSEFLNPSRFTDDVVVIDPSGKIAPLPPIPKLDFSKKLRYTGRTSFGLHMTEKDISGKAKNYTFGKDGKGGFLPSHGITIGDVRWPLSDLIEIEATREGKNMLIGKQAGGRLKSPISASGVPKKSLDKILAEYESPSTIMDPRLSGFAHANDPTLQNVRGDIRDWHNEQIQKKFEKQAKKDQLIKTIASAAISAGISGAMGKFSEIGGADKLAKDRGFDSYKDMVKDPEFAGELKAMGMQKTKFGYNLKHFSSNLGSRRQAGHGWGGLGDVGSGLDRFGRKFGSDEWVNWRSSEGPGGWSYKKGSWGRNDPGEQRGGYIDNIPAMLTGGEFVMSSSAVRRHGSGFLNGLNRGGRVGYQQGGLVGDQGVVPAENNVSQQTNTSERTNSNTTINITVNSGGEQGEQSSEGQPGTKEKELATRIRGAVLSVLREEKRTGGTLRDVTGET